MVESLSHISGRIQKISTYISVMSRYTLNYTTVFIKLNTCIPIGKSYNTRLLQAEASLDTFEIFQLFHSKTLKG